MAKLTRAQADALHLLYVFGPNVTLETLRANEVRVDVLHRLCGLNLAYCSRDTGHDDTTYSLTRAGIAHPDAESGPRRRQPVKAFTVLVEAAAAGGWQPVRPAETVTAGDLGGGDWTAAQVALETAVSGEAADGELWRVCVWEGSNAGTTKPAAVVRSDHPLLFWLEA